MRASTIKLIFLLLLLVNLAVFAWQRGAFGDVPETGREPERVARQIEPDRIRVLTEAEVRELRKAAEQNKSRESAAPSLIGGITAKELASGAACVEFGDFTTDVAANRVQERLAALALGDRLGRRAVDAPGWFMVYVPPFRTRAEVERAAAELRRLGVKDLLVIADNSPMRFGIALGSFRDQDLAVKHQADLERRGAVNVRVAERPSSLPATRFQIRNVDNALAEKLVAIQKDYTQQKLSACGAG
jgi:hypothetical protein